MPKSASPIRLSQSLMELAVSKATLQHRSTAEQIEYWAAIGRQVENILSPEHLLKLNAGLLRLRIEQAPDTDVSGDAVFKRLISLQKSGELARSVSDVWPRYQASEKHPGYLERVNQSGKVELGSFKNGQFKAVRKP